MTSWIKFTKICVILTQILTKDKMNKNMDEQKHFFIFFGQKQLKMAFNVMIYVRVMNMTSWMKPALIGGIIALILTEYKMRNILGDPKGVFSFFNHFLGNKKFPNWRFMVMVQLKICKNTWCQECLNWQKMSKIFLTLDSRIFVYSKYLNQFWCQMIL